MSKNQRRLAVKHTRAAINAIRHLSFLRIDAEDVERVCKAIAEEVSATRAALLGKPEEFKLEIKDE